MIFNILAKVLIDKLFQVTVPANIITYGMILTGHQNLRRSLMLFRATGVLIILSGLVSITGWFLHVHMLTSIVPDYATMKFNTALCFVISGTCFLLLIQPYFRFQKNIVAVLGICLFALAATSLSEDMFKWSAGIDQFFVADYVSASKKYPFPGRMSPSTSSCFTFLAISLAGIGSPKLLYRKIAQYLLHLVSLIAFIAMIGYLLKVPFTLKFRFFSTMAVNTSAAFLLFSTVASLINYDLGFTSLFTGKQVGNIIARKLFPKMIAILIVVGYISLQLQRENYITTEFGVVLSTISFLIIGLFLIRGTLTELNLLDLKRTAAETETQLLNKNLENMVLQRTQELEHSHERFVKIFKSNPVCIAITNLDNGEYVDVNAALLELLKYERDEIIGQTAAGLSIISTTYRSYMVANLGNPGALKNEDIVLQAKDGSIKHCILTAELLEDAHQKYLLSFVYDITDRKLIENNLQESKVRLEILADKLTRQNKQLLSFAHITSHNLRTPVSNLSLLMTFYNESTDQEDRDELWGNFQTVVGHLDGTLNELIETLIIQEDTSRENEVLSFEDTFKSVKEILIGQIKECGAVVNTDFSKATHISYPKIYLESIMLNLISNAIKYRAPNRSLVVGVTSYTIGEEIILIVQDNGLGIDMATHGKYLFGLRKTFHNHTDAKGVGLFLTKTQIETMGGTISAESEVDKGTTFKVIFNKVVA